MYCSQKRNKTNDLYNSVLRFFGFEKDSAGVYHVNQQGWQKYGGYSDLYDFVFSIGTSMKKRKISI